MAEDQEVVDLEQEEGGDQAGLASSSSSEGDLELQTASSSSPQSHSKSRSVPPKPAVPRQRPVIPPRPKETTASNSEGLEPTPFDYTDPFQAYENREKSAQSSKEQKPSPPQITAKPSRPPTMKKPQQSVDASTSSASSVTSEQTTAAQSKVRGRGELVNHASYTTRERERENGLINTSYKVILQCIDEAHAG